MIPPEIFGKPHHLRNNYIQEAGNHASRLDQTLILHAARQRAVCYRRGCALVVATSAAVQPWLGPLLGQHCPAFPPYKQKYKHCYGNHSCLVSTRAAVDTTAAFKATTKGKRQPETPAATPSRTTIILEGHTGSIFAHPRELKRENSMLLRL
ncbi:unnamed protein product [Ectocarpus sp. 8 AP-2014]